MISGESQLNQPSRSTRPEPLITPTGHPDPLRTPTHQGYVDPLHTLYNPSMARARPYLYSSHPSRLHLTPPSSNPPSIVAWSSPAQPSSLPLPRVDARSVPSKRTRDYAANPPTLHHTSPIPSSSSLSLATQLSVERPAKRQRLDMGRSSTVTHRGGSRVSATSKPSPLSQPPMLGPTLPRPRPKPRKAPLHPLAVDYGRPIKPVVPQPPFCRLSLRQNRIPLPPTPEIPDAKRLLEEELKGPIDPAVARELGDLTWMQQKRVWGDDGGYSDPFLHPTHISLLEARPSSSCGGAALDQSLQDVTALYGPPKRNNESFHLGESLTNPNVVVLGEDQDDGFEAVLDLYRGAVQSSTLSMELELAVRDDDALAVTGWETASSLELGVERRSSAPTPSGEPPESRIRSLAEYRQVVKAEKAASASKPVTTTEEPPLGIEWTHSCCGYASGRVVNAQKATVRR